MAAQEFSSPGEHMASMANGSSQSNAIQVAGRNPNAPISNLSNVIYAPALSSKARDDFNDTMPRGRSSRYNDIDDYLAAYTKHNEKMFLNAQAWEKMMSDTSIRRQMEDLKAAGINPILAGRLGGAQYHSVNAPYTTINPGQAYSSMYATDVGQQNVIRQVEANLEIANLDRENMLQIARENNLNSKEVASLISSTDIIQQEMQDKVLTSGQDKSFTASIISSGVHGLGALALIANHFKNKGSGSSFGGSSGNVSKNEPNANDPSYNKWFVDNVLNKKYAAGELTAGDVKNYLDKQHIDIDSKNGMIEAFNAVTFATLMGIAQGVPVPVG